MNLSNQKSRFLFATCLALTAVFTVILFGLIITPANAATEWHIRDDTTGGDCSAIGNWDASTRTCTLTTTVNQPIQIESDSITLDGNGNTVIGNGTIADGIYLYQRTGVTIKNINVKSFCVGIRLAYSNNNTITNNTVTNGGCPGIYLDNSSKNTLAGNNSSNNSAGIWLSLGSSSNTITGNITNSNQYIGIRIDGVSFNNTAGVNTLDGNIANFNRTQGIQISLTGENVLRNNRMSGNPYNFGIVGGVLPDSDVHNIIDTTNLVDGKPIYYVEGAVGTVYDSSTNAGVFYCINCNNVTIKDLTLTSNLFGIFFWKTNNSRIENVVVSNNFHGVDTFYSSNNILTLNTISSNYYAGIYAYFSNGNTFIENKINYNRYSGLFFVSSNDNTLTKNTISDAYWNGNYYGYGVDFESSSNNKVFNNNFVNNVNQAFVSGGQGNTFNNDTSNGGNYWSNFDEPAEGCNNANGDNFCDSPYVFQGGQDNLPWTKKDGWLIPSNQPPTLSYSQEAGYVDDGINPDEGYSDTNFTFKIVYADQDNDPPTDIRTVVFDGSPSDAPAIEISSDVMVSDLSANLELRDGNYANGEQYALTKSFPTGTYRYRFQASDGEIDTILDGIAGGKEQRFEVSRYSNIVFLPGILGSRLYTEGENQLWEPNRHEDVRQLYMESDGTSSNLGIYAKEGQVIDQIQKIGGNIYESFLDDLERWKTEEKIIKDYAVIPYDWRLDFDDLLAQGRSDGEKIYYSQTADISYITETIKNLAVTSDTGKVVIVAHSMGGLIAKKVIDKLVAQGDTGLVEQLILVASPQLGTPKAILGLLHGEEVTGLSRLVINQEEQRTLAENMPTAYALLPSEEYFRRVLDPVVKFNIADSLLAPFVSSYGDSIDNIAELNNFLLGKESGRIKPSPEDTLTPNILNEYLVQKKATVQSRLDNWQIPFSIQVSQIAGWGLDTIRALDYREEEVKGCGGWTLALKCWTKKVFWHEPDFTIDGDETVVEPSATALLGAEKFYVNLPDYNNEFFALRINRDHSDIFEVGSVRELIKQLVKNEVTPSNLPLHITATKPNSYSDESKRLRIRALSPVAVNIYDSVGNHTGLALYPNATSSVMVVDEEIPNSYYLEIGEGKYLGVGSQDTYRIEFTGQDLGSVTLAIDEVTGDNVTGSRVFSNIPIIKGTKGTLTTQTLQNMSNLSLDIENDGVIDFSIAPQSVSSPLTSVELLRRIVLALKLPKGIEQGVVSKVDAVLYALNRGNTKTAVNQINALINYIEAQAGKQIPLEESGKLLNTIEKIKRNLLSL